jgi:DNA-binding NarL/FixJ family response regulator
MTSARERIPVLVSAVDDVLRQGVRTTLRELDTVHLVDDASGAEVAVLVVDRVDDQLGTLLDNVRHHGVTRIVLISGATDDNAALNALESGVCAVLARAHVTGTLLGKVIAAAAAGQGIVSPALLGRLLERVALLRDTTGALRAHPYGMSKREIEVFQKLADGMTTTEVAHALFVSERTIKDVLTQVYQRFNLRNRAHAMAYVIRQGFV